MAAQAPEFDLKQIVLFDGTFGPKETERLTQAVCGADSKVFDSLREAVGELEDKENREELSPAGRVRLGVGFYLTGRYDKAAEKLKKGDSGALALFYLAKSCFALQEYDQALKYYDQSQKAGYGKDACTLGKAEVYRYKNEPEKALAELDALSGAVEQTAEYLY
ncbi:MAG: CDC27 family protein, partial [Planctomycetaceae bacterium]|nr:CDC27 family protein [Planctomycetaceae bacterium]